MRPARHGEGSGAGVTGPAAPSSLLPRSRQGGDELPCSICLLLMTHSALYPFICYSQLFCAPHHALCYFTVHTSTLHPELLGFCSFLPLTLLFCALLLISTITLFTPLTLCSQSIVCQDIRMVQQPCAGGGGQQRVVKEQPYHSV